MMAFFQHPPSSLGLIPGNDSITSLNDPPITHSFHDLCWWTWLICFTHGEPAYLSCGRRKAAIPITQELQLSSSELEYILKIPSRFWLNYLLKPFDLKSRLFNIICSHCKLNMRAQFETDWKHYRHTFHHSLWMRDVNRSDSGDTKRLETWAAFKHINNMKTVCLRSLVSISINSWL